MKSKKYHLHYYVETASGMWEGNQITVIHEWTHPTTGEKLIHMPYKYFKEVHDWTEAQFLEAYKPDMWAEIREKRDTLLTETDWVSGDDVPTAHKTKWNTYRQALRDVTSQSDPYNITWPTEPS